MDLKVRWIRCTLLAFAIGWTLAGCATNPQGPSPGLLQKVENAHTRADHEELATYYDQAAKEALSTAAANRRLAKAYQSWQGTGRGGSGIYSHCIALAALYEKTAEEQLAMAAAHRQLGQQANPY